MSGAGLTSRRMMVPRSTAIDRITAGPPSNGWPTKRMFVGWEVCCMPAMDLRCDWACDTCPWMAITRTLPPCSSSMAVCITGTIVASFRTHGSALLPRRDGSPQKRTMTTWGPPVTTHLSPSGSASGKTSSVLTLTRPRSVKAKQARARTRHCRAPVCWTPGLTWNRFCRPYVRTASSVWPRWTSTHLRTWRTSFVTYHLSSRAPWCLERMPVQHMARFCETAGLVSRPRMSLISAFRPPDADPNALAAMVLAQRAHGHPVVHLYAVR